PGVASRRYAPPETHRRIREVPRLAPARHRGGDARTSSRLRRLQDGRRHRRISRRGAQPVSTFLHATIKVHAGCLPRFNAVLAEMKPALEAEGWRLVGAWVTTVGRLSQVVDVWELPDANAVSDVLNVVRHNPKFPEWYEELNAIVDDEVLQLMVKLP